MYQITFHKDAGLSSDQAGFLQETLSETLEGFLSLSLFDGRITLLFENRIAPEKAWEILEPEKDVPAYEEEEINSDQDWLEICYQQQPPFEAGVFWVYGSHITQDAPADLIPLQIDAVQAFGSGSHGTTKGCLILLSWLKELGIQPARILDVGTGSGILAIAAKKLFPKVDIMATDNDPACIEATHIHAQKNEATLQDVILAEGFTHDDVQNTAPFDFIIANILPHILMDLAQDIKACIKPDGYCLLSGIPSDRAKDVQACYETLGFNLSEIHTEDDWVSQLYTSL